jgi:hypothetical protein
MSFVLVLIFRWGTINIKDYFGSLKDDDILDEIDKFSSKIRNSSRLQFECTREDL